MCIGSQVTSRAGTRQISKRDTQEPVPGGQTLPHGWEQKVSLIPQPPRIEARVMIWTQAASGFRRSLPASHFLSPSLSTPEVWAVLGSDGNHIEATMSLKDIIMFTTSSMEKTNEGSGIKNVSPRTPRNITDAPMVVSTSQAEAQCLGISTFFS